MAPSLVQIASAATSTLPLTITLGSSNPAGPSPGPTTAGNCLVALFGTSADTTNGTVSGVTLGGVADNWAQSATEGTSGDHAIVYGWADPLCAGGQTSIVISLSGGTGDHLFGWVFEFSGLTGIVDVSSGASTAGFTSSWTSGTTGSTTQASEVAFGISCGASSGTPGLTGPSSPWINEAQQTLAGSVHTKVAIAGYQILSATGTQVYSGSSNPTNTNDTLVYTLEASAGGGIVIAGPLTPNPVRRPVVVVSNSGWQNAGHSR